MRLSPLAPDSIMNYLMSLTGIPLLTFTSATGLAMVRLDKYIDKL